MFLKDFFITTQKGLAMMPALNLSPFPWGQCFRLFDNDFTLGSIKSEVTYNHRDDSRDPL